MKQARRLRSSSQPSGIAFDEMRVAQLISRLRCTAKSRLIAAENAKGRLHGMASFCPAPPRVFAWTSATACTRRLPRENFSSRFAQRRMLCARIPLEDSIAKSPRGRRAFLIAIRPATHALRTHAARRLDCEESESRAAHLAGEESRRQAGARRRRSRRGSAAVRGCAACGGSRQRACRGPVPRRVLRRPWCRVPRCPGDDGAVRCGELFFCLD